MVQTIIISRDDLFSNIATTLIKVVDPQVQVYNIPYLTNLANSTYLIGLGNKEQPNILVVGYPQNNSMALFDQNLQKDDNATYFLYGDTNQTNEPFIYYNDYADVQANLTTVLLDYYSKLTHNSCLASNNIYFVIKENHKEDIYYSLNDLLKIDRDTTCAELLIAIQRVGLATLIQNVQVNQQVTITVTKPNLLAKVDCRCSCSHVAINNHDYVICSTMDNILPQLLLPLYTDASGAFSFEMTARNKASVLRYYWRNLPQDDWQTPLIKSGFFRQGKGNRVSGYLLSNANGYNLFEELF